MAVRSSRRRALARTLAVSGLLAAACATEDGAPGASASAKIGASHYARTCALCHGPKGEGYLADNATALDNPTFLATASDEFLRRSIARGRPGTTMSAWALARGGPHDDEAIGAIIAFMRTWQTVPSAPLGSASITGDAARGASVYASRCASCHGATGHEGPNVRLANAELLAAATDAFLRYAIVHGRPGTAMPAFERDLAPGDVDDVVALLRGWATPVSEGEAPIPGTLGPIVLNPDGPEPAFELGRRYTDAATIKRELDRGAAMGFLDARAPSDYVTSHIQGATSVPFYEATEHVSALPKDRWLVSYCGCPHAESGSLADTLFAHGFTKVTILDEGFYEWRDRGYPVRTGAYP